MSFSHTQGKLLCLTEAEELNKDQVSSFIYFVLRFWFICLLLLHIYACVGKKSRVILSVNFLCDISKNHILKFSLQKPKMSDVVCVCLGNLNIYGAKLRLLRLVLMNFHFTPLRLIYINKLSIKCTFRTVFRK